MITVLFFFKFMGIMMAEGGLSDQKVPPKGSGFSPLSLPQSLQRQNLGAPTHF